MEPDSCDNCRFSQFIDSGYRYCRRFPPTLILSLKVRQFQRDPRTYDAVFPHVPWDEWCGEHELAPDPNGG